MIGLLWVVHTLTPDHSPSGGVGGSDPKQGAVYYIIPNLTFALFQQRGPKPCRPPPAPRPQIKTCPPLSRIFKHRPEIRAAQSVIFRDSTNSNSLYEQPLLDSTVYNSAKKASYYEQVRLYHLLMGSGSFRRLAVFRPIKNIFIGPNLIAVVT